MAIGINNGVASFSSLTLTDSLTRGNGGTGTDTPCATLEPVYVTTTPFSLQVGRLTRCDKATQVSVFLPTSGMSVGEVCGFINEGVGGVRAVLNATQNCKFLGTSLTTGSGEISTTEIGARVEFMLITDSAGVYTFQVSYAFGSLFTIV
jgi:hypothetical protein